MFCLPGFKLFNQREDKIYKIKLAGKNQIYNPYIEKKKSVTINVTMADTLQ